MKILVTGKNGQVGFELQRALAVLGHVVAVDVEECNLADADSIRALIQQHKPQIIVHPAAYTAVDKAESDLATAFAVNAQAPGVIGEEAAKLGALVIHFSTDYVFDGSKDTPYVETDTPNPQSVYGQSKLDGEKALAHATPNYVILRTSWVVGAHGGNFAKTMLRLAADREQLNVVADQYGAPTSAALLADITAHLVRQYQQAGADSFPFGLYHVTGSGSTNWCEYAQFVIQQALAAGKVLKATPQNILPITTAQYPTPARRPTNSRLNCQRFEQAFGLQLPSWQAGLQ